MRRLCLLTLLAVATHPLRAADVTVSIDTPLSPPTWALLQRSLLDANTAACREFARRYHD